MKQCLYLLKILCFALLKFDVIRLKNVEGWGCTYALIFVVTHIKPLLQSHLVDVNGTWYGCSTSVFLWMLTNGFLSDRSKTDPSNKSRSQRGPSFDKQNRSSEECWKFRVRKHNKFRREWSQHKNKCKSKLGQNQVSGGVSVVCWLAAPVANVLWKSS